MLHNLLIVNPEQATVIGELTMKLGLDDEDKGWVPESDGHYLIMRGVMEVGN